MKIILFFVMTLSLMISPVAINADPIVETPMVEKIKDQMRLKSQMTENEANSFDYWCLSDHLNKITGTKMEQYYTDKKIDDEKLLKNAEEIYEKYSSDENYLFHHGEPTLYYSTSGNYISLLIDAENPLKMLKAQEIRTNYNYTMIERGLILGSESIFAESCVDTLENMLDIKVPQYPQLGYKQYVNIRDDIVNVKTFSVKPLLERGYLVYLAWS